MTKQIIAGIGIIACVALCAAVWPRSAEVEELPGEPVKNAVSAEIEARSEETPHIFISEDVPEPVAEVIAEDEPEDIAKAVAESGLKETIIRYSFCAGVATDKAYASFLCAPILRQVFSVSPGAMVLQ